MANPVSNNTFHKTFVNWRTTEVLYQTPEGPSKLFKKSLVVLNRPFQELNNNELSHKYVLVPYERQGRVIEVTFNDDGSGYAPECVVAVE